MKLFNDKDGRPWKESISSGNHELLLVSQFTLEACFKGAKPDFHKSMGGDLAIDLFNFAVAEAGKLHPGGPDMVKTGSFGADMQVALVNDGPVTIMYEYPDKSKSDQGKVEVAKNAEKLKKQQEREENARKKKEKKDAMIAARIEKNGGNGENGEKEVSSTAEKIENLVVTEN